MKIRPACAAVISIGTALLLLSAIRCAQAAEIKIVSPGAYEDIEGPNRSGTPWPAAARAQGIAHRSEFDALPVGGAWLTEYRFRPDGAVPVGAVASFGRVQFSLSVTQVDPLDISFTFAANITGTPVEVYNAAWSSTVINPDPPGAETRPFDFRFPLETPYFYNPAEGNLLIDKIFEMPGSGVNGLARLDLDLSNAFSGNRNIWSDTLGVDSPMSFAATWTAINEYVFIPVTPGDYNRDGTVDAADYVVWRKGLGTTYTQADYDVWRANFGQTIGSGAALPSADPLSVIPEPSTALIVFVGSLALAACCRPTHVRLRRKIERKKMKYWQAWMACGLLMSLPAAAQADIFRWDNGQLIPGTEGITPGPAVDLSYWFSPERNLGFADFTGGLDLTQASFYNSWLDDSRFNGANLTNAFLVRANLTNADLSGTNLTNAQLGRWSCPEGACLPGGVATLTNANLSGAVVTGANFYTTTSRGFTKEQLYSTASYQQRNLGGIGLSSNDLTGWDFSAQNLTGAVLSGSTLTNANLAGAMVTGANFGDATSRGFTKEQLYSTASYQQRNLGGIGLSFNDLTGWDFSGQDLTGADFFLSTLTNANLTGAVVTGAGFLYVTSQGFTKEQLYSTASYQQRNLGGIRLFYNDLTGWDFSGQDLTGAVFFDSFLTNANFAGAMVTGATFSWPTLQGGFTKEQLYSTASYQQRNLGGIGLVYNDLTGWDFSGQDLTGAVFFWSTLTNANFSFADLRGSQLNTAGPFQTRNTIRELGAINGLDLEAGETLIVRDSDIGITVNDSMNAVSGGTLELVLGDADWGSTMAVAAGVTPDLGGTLRVRFADQASLASMLGKTFDFFDWPGELETNNRFDAIELPPGTLWDFSQFYVTGTAKITAIPEPSALLLLACAAAACAVARLRFPNVQASKRKITMKVRPACAAVVSIGTALLLLSAIRCAQAAEIKIVSPSAYEDIEGEGAIGEDCCSPFRYQQVFPAADFAALGNKPHWLVDFTVRPDQGLTSPRTVHYPDDEVRLSTTQRGPDNLSLRFDDNLGSDVMQFYRGPQMLVAAVIAPGPGPREFYHAVRPAGVTPYLFDPSKGNLLFDAIGRQAVSPSHLRDEVPGIRSALVGSSPSAMQGVRHPAGVFQFTFIPVPEPATLTLMIMGMVVHYARRRRAVS